MTNKTFTFTPKTFGIIAAVVVPMLLIPTTGNARSSYEDWSSRNQPIKVKQSQERDRDDRKSNARTLRNLFDGSAPRTSRAKNRVRSRQMNRSRFGARKRSGRQGYTGDYYEGEYGASCASPRTIHRRLKRQGWRNFHNLSIRPNVLRFKARQVHQRNFASDLTYDLRIDRCSGALIKVKLQRQDMWYIRWMRRISSLF